MYKKGSLFKVKANNKVCVYVRRYGIYEHVVFYDDQEWVFFENELEVIDVQSK